MAMYWKFQAPSTRMQVSLTAGFSEVYFMCYWMCTTQGSALFFRCSMFVEYTFCPVLLSDVSVAFCFVRNILQQQTFLCLPSLSLAKPLPKHILPAVMHKNYSRALLVQNPHSFFSAFLRGKYMTKKSDYHNDLQRSPQSIKRIPSKKETCSLFLWMVIIYSVKNTTGITFPWMSWDQNLLDDMGAGDSLGFLPLKYSDILPTLSSHLYFSSNYEPIRWTFCKSSREM